MLRRLLQDCQHMHLKALSSVDRVSAGIACYKPTHTPPGCSGLSQFLGASCNGALKPSAQGCLTELRDSCLIIIKRCIRLGTVQRTCKVMEATSVNLPGGQASNSMQRPSVEVDARWRPSGCQATAVTLLL